MSFNAILPEDCQDAIQVDLLDEGTTIRLLPLPLNLSHLRHQIPNLVAVEFCDRGNPVNVLDEVFR